MRGLAMCMVVASHLIWPTPTLGAFDRVLFNGWVGVDLFFVLSGFLITGILCDTRDEPTYFRRFYYRRALRIFPIYYLLLTIVLIAVPAAARIAGIRLTHSAQTLQAQEPWYWLYGVNMLQVKRPFAIDRSWLGHTWTLSVEEQFYLLWPALIWLVPRKRLPALCMAAIVAAVAGRMWVAAHGDTFRAFAMTPLRLDSLAVGALIAVLWRRDDGRRLLRRWYRPVGIVAGVAFVAIQIGYGARTLSTPLVTVGLFTNAIASGALITAVIQARAPISSWLAQRHLMAAGRISYGAYLYHFPLISLLSPLRTRLYEWGLTSGLHDGVAHAAWMLVAFAVTMIVASMSYRFIERPILALKDPSARLARIPALAA